MATILSQAVRWHHSSGEEIHSFPDDVKVRIEQDPIPEMKEQQDTKDFCRKYEVITPIPNNHYRLKSILTLGFYHRYQKQYLKDALQQENGQGRPCRIGFG